MDNQQHVMAFIEAVFVRQHLRQEVERFLEALEPLGDALPLESKLVLFRNVRAHVETLVRELEAVEQVVVKGLPQAVAFRETENVYPKNTASRAGVALPVTATPDPPRGEALERSPWDAPSSGVPSFEPNAYTASDENNLSWRTISEAAVSTTVSTAVPKPNAVAYGGKPRPKQVATLAAPPSFGVDADQEEDTIVDAPIDEMMSSGMGLSDDCVVHESDLLRMAQGRGTDVEFPENPKATLLGMGYATDLDSDDDTSNEHDTESFKTKEA
jgi:hypothetical protein